MVWAGAWLSGQRPAGAGRLADGRRKMSVGEARGGKPSSAGPIGVAAVAVAGALGMALVSVLDTDTQPALPSGDASPQSTGVIAQPGQPGPGAMPGVANDQTPGAGPDMGVEIVVKFRDDAKVKDIIDAYWKDAASARRKFETFKAGRPEFATLTLDRVTYSNELVLVPSAPVAAAERMPAMRALAARISGVADISYAEPNMTAHPGDK